MQTQAILSSLKSAEKKDEAKKLDEFLPQLKKAAVLFNSDFDFSIIEATDTESDEVETTEFPSKAQIEECKSTDDLMSLISTPLSEYIKNNPDFLKIDESEIPEAIIHLLRYWQKIGENNLSLLQDKDNLINNFLSQLEKNLLERQIAIFEAKNIEGENIARHIKLIECGASVAKSLKFAAQNGKLNAINNLFCFEMNLINDTAIKKAIDAAIKANQLDVITLLWTKRSWSPEEIAQFTPDKLNSLPLETAKFLLNLTQYFTYRASCDYTPDELTSLIKIYGIEETNKWRISTSAGEETLLMHALENNQMTKVKILLEQSADTHFVRKDGMTLLMIAARNGNNELIKDLFEKKHSAVAADKRGYTALVHAVEGNHLKRSDCIKTLLKHIPSEEIKSNSCKENPMFIAFKKEFQKPCPQEKMVMRDGHCHEELTNGMVLEILKLLYSKTSEKDIQQLFWQTIESNNHDKLYVFMLLPCKEKLYSWKNKQNETAFEMAKRLKHKEMQKEIITRFELLVDDPIDCFVM